jgi:hypothetical protein
VIQSLAEYQPISAQSQLPSMRLQPPGHELGEAHAHDGRFDPEPQQHKHKLREVAGQNRKLNKELQWFRGELDKAHAHNQHLNTELQCRRVELDKAHAHNQHLNTVLQCRRVESEDVQAHNQQLNKELERLGQELMEMQGREFASRKRGEIESHEAISAEFTELFRRCGMWARENFNIGLKEFRVEDFPKFQEEVALVSWDADWHNKKRFKVSHLIQAILGHILVDEMFEDPFRGCAVDFGVPFGSLYKFKLQGTIEITYIK